MDRTPHELRLHAEHYRYLAHSQIDERLRSLLTRMADGFDDEARELDGAAAAARPSGEDSAC